MIDINSGDTVLIGAPAGSDAAELQAVKDQLQNTFPGVSFIVMAGLTIQGVVHPDLVEQLGGES